MERIGQRVLSSEVFWTGLSLLLMVGAAAVVAAGLLSLSAPIVVAAVLAFLGCLVILANPYAGVLLFLTLLYVRPEQFFPQVAPLRLPFVLSC
ncbi:MAG TPA: hypothetical protein VFU47_06500, partial [Armatimonadota bacterium]|nr:hypothetical protein [Armatimonadota bacterium]